MNSFNMYPLSIQVSDELKDTMRDQFGNEPTLEQAQSRRSICRRCLRRFNPGERRLLFKYRPFQREGVFAEAGPIYIHENDCRPDTEILTSYPDDFRELPLLLRAYTKDDEQVDSQPIKDGDAETVIDKFYESTIATYSRNLVGGFADRNLRRREYLESPAQSAIPLHEQSVASGPLARRARSCRVFLILSLVALRYVDEAILSDKTKNLVRWSLPSAAILLPVAFFLSVLSPDATRPNGLIYLAYVGAIILATGLITLGVGLLRKANI